MLGLCVYLEPSYCLKAIRFNHIYFHLHLPAGSGPYSFNHSNHKG